MYGACGRSSAAAQAGCMPLRGTGVCCCAARVYAAKAARGEHASHAGLMPCGHGVSTFGAGYAPAAREGMQGYALRDCKGDAFAGERLTPRELISERSCESVAVLFWWQEKIEVDRGCFVC